MKLNITPVISIAIASWVSADPVHWVPDGLPAAPDEGPALCQGNFLKPDVAAETLDEALDRFPDRESWEAYAAHLRERIQAGANLDPWPEKTPLEPIIRDAREHDGYSVANVAFESVPGYFVTGNLYRPTGSEGPHAVVLCPHGHAADKRLKADVQARCAALARMGAIVLSIDMVGFGESGDLVGPEAHRRPFTLTLQTWNARRALDFLLAQEGADPERVGVTGGSGGGTQAFVLAATDPRVTLSVPVVMVSAHFFGGCDCESGLPIHRSDKHFANNAIIAALAAPRPQLIISDGADWTAHNPEVEFPFLQRVYGYYDAAGEVANVHLADEGHDYGPSKRAAMYRFVAKHFGLDPELADEARATIEEPEVLKVFPDEEAIPERALRDIEEVEKVFRGLQEGAG